jgi:hypothetical protein
LAETRIRYTMSESIYSWIKETPPPPEKPPMYHSKFKGTQPVSKAHSSFNEVTLKKPIGTIGREVKDTVTPQAFLKAHEKTDKVDVTKTLRTCTKLADPSYHCG